jgi:glycosyltransferase involved in cell wall biosynthesis
MLNGAPWRKVSIVTPSFNQGPFIEETIRSVLLQGYPNLEYIIIDGGSTDGTVEILRRYEPWLTYWVSEPDRGQSHAINKGWAHATGDWLGWLNSDDIYLPGVFQRVMDAVVTDPTLDLVYGDVEYVNQDGSHRAVKYSAPFGLRAMALRSGLIHTPSVFWQRRLNDLAGALEERYHFSMDNDFWLRVAPHARCVYLPGAMGTFRRHDDSKTVHSEFRLVEETYDIYLRQLASEPFASLLSEAEKRQILGGLVWQMGVLAQRAGRSDQAQRSFLEAIVTHRILDTPDAAALRTVKVLLEDRAAPAEEVASTICALPLEGKDKQAFASLVWDHFYQVQFYGGFAQGWPKQVIRSAFPLAKFQPARLAQRGFVSIFARSLASILRSTDHAA